MPFSQYREFDDLLQGHVYSCYASELLIDGIFVIKKKQSKLISCFFFCTQVRTYNLNPEWTIPNPEDFTAKLMHNITNGVTELRKKKHEYEALQSQTDLTENTPQLISHLTEAVRAIINIFSLQCYNPSIFTPKNLTTIVHLLHVTILSPSLIDNNLTFERMTYTPL